MGKEYLFLCSGCTEEIMVDEEMRRVLLSENCVVCGSPVTPEDFIDPHQLQSSEPTW